MGFLIFWYFYRVSTVSSRTTFVVKAKQYSLAIVVKQKRYKNGKWKSSRDGSCLSNAKEQTTSHHKFSCVSSSLINDNKLKSANLWSINLISAVKLIIS